MATHENLEFHVENRNGQTVVETDPAKAFGLAVSISASRGGEPVNVDVVCWSRDAAEAWAGEHGGEEYDADPEASVHDRIVIRAESLGRIA